MKRSYLKVISGLAVAVVFAMTMLYGAQGHAQSDDHGVWEGGLEGTWIVQVTQHNCQTGAVLAPPFISLLTFAQGGTMTETTSNPMLAPPVVRGPGHGVWSETGHRTYRASSIALITINGVLAKTQTITQKIEVTGPDDFTTTEATVEFFSPGGTLLSTGCATAEGK